MTIPKIRQMQVELPNGSMLTVDFTSALETQVRQRFNIHEGELDPELVRSFLAHEIASALQKQGT